MKKKVNIFILTYRFIFVYLIAQFMSAFTKNSYTLLGTSKWRKIPFF